MGVLRYSGIAGIVVGSILIVVAGVVGWIVVPNVIDSKIKEETRLMSDSETWEKWFDIKFPMSLKFYIYHIENPEVLLDPSNIVEKIQFSEKGPYVYTEHRYKVNVSIEREGEVKYQQKIDYFFNELESVGPENDTFTIVNVPLISVATAGFSRKDDQELAALYMLLAYLSGNISASANENFIKTASVKEITFGGWPLHDRYKLIHTGSPADFPPEFGDPEAPTFGFYTGKNETGDGEFVIRTGSKNHEEFGRISTWKQPGFGWVGGVQYPYNASSELNWWYSQEDDPTTNETVCNKINGSDGSLHTPFNTKDTILPVFQTEICRSVYLTYQEEIKFRDIDGYRYTLPEDIFGATGENDCFCPHPSPMFPDRLAHHCVKGVNRIFPCKSGAPIVVSNVHFLHADDSVFEAIELLNAKQDPEMDITILDIQPDSGMVLRASRKIQINVELQKLDLPEQPGIGLPFTHINFTTLTSARSILLPVIWAEETMELDEENAQELYDKLIRPQKIITIVKWVVIALGALVLLLGIVGTIKG